ncbi:MAG: acetate--CoA ligase family protein [Chloroflexi bacterium]|nr:acetate--CoA ligase family protein [Chloroflexota bacterium]
MLEMFFAPKSVAVIGASHDKTKLGYVVLNNILQYGYKGKVYAVNPKVGEILGLKVYPTIAAIPEPVDLAVVVIPAQFVVGVIEEAGQKGVKGAVIISAGFRETGSEGLRREREVIKAAKKHNVRLLGPNVLGIIDTISCLNASFAAGMPERGEIAFMSQSGALCTAVLDIALAERVGFSRFVSLGNKADVNEISLLETWDEDPYSKVIMAYLEGITDGQAFIEVARRVTKSTPVIAIKSGTTEGGTRAVSSHTGTLAGSERAYEAAFNQSGVIRATSIEDLFDFSTAFAYQPVVKGDHVAIVTNAGGPGIMATDALEYAGLSLASFNKETIEHLHTHLPPTANIYNPVDVIGDAGADRYAHAMRAVLADENVAGLLVLVAPQAMTPIVEVARTVVDIAGEFDKPVFGCFMGEQVVQPGIKILRENRIPNYRFPERAVAAMKAMAKYRRWLERPALEIPRFDLDRDRITAVFAKARAENRLGLGDIEAREVAEAIGLRVPRTAVAKTPEDAVALAGEIGYPVAMKVVSPDILHKSDIGAVRVGVAAPEDVRDTFDLIEYRSRKYVPDADIWGVAVQEMVRKGKETIIGVNRDPQFGPLLLFGLGGIYVEVLKDVTFRIAPISALDAREMVAEIRSYPLLRGVRGEPPSDLDSAVDAILRISQLVTEFPEIVEMDVNPLVVAEAGQGSVALDVRMVLRS